MGSNTLTKERGNKRKEGKTLIKKEGKRTDMKEWEKRKSDREKIGN